MSYLLIGKDECSLSGCLVWHGMKAPAQAIHPGGIIECDLYGTMTRLSVFSSCVIMP